MIKVKEDLTGRIFGRLTVLKQVDDYISPQGNHSSRWLCQCCCVEHNKVVVCGTSLKRGFTKSCGCLKKERCSEAGKLCKKFNKYDLSGNYGVGWTNNTNKEFYFDLNDYDLIKDYCWYERIEKNGYNPLVSHDSKTHRSIKMTALLGCKNYDHINRNPLDNRRNNLRQATASQNGMNSNVKTNNTSGVIGVCWHKQKRKWTASIVVNKQQIYLGYYTDFNDAVKARLEAEVKYFGEFAPQKHLYEQYKISEEYINRSNHLFVCERCLYGIESHEGNQATMRHYVDCDDEKHSKCDWCEDSGFDTLYELV